MAKMLCGFVAALFLALGTADAQEFVPSDWTYEMTGPGSGIQHTGDGVRLMYRPHLISKSDWSDGSLSFSWRHFEASKAPDGRIYGDHLIVFLSSDGTFRKERSYEVKTGVVIRFDSVTGNITIATAVDGENFEVLKTGKSLRPVDAPKPITIVDRNGTITVSVGAEEVVSAAVPAAARKGKVWGLYNREPVANATNVSIISKIVRK